MKKFNRKHQQILTILFLTAVTSFTAGVLNAQLLTYDGLTGASAPGPLDDVNTGTGWHASWDVQLDDPQYTVQTASPLTFGLLQTSTEYANGGSTDFNQAGRRLDTGAGGVWDSAGAVSDPFISSVIDTGTVWGTFLLRPNALVAPWDTVEIGFINQNIPWFLGAANGARLISQGGGDWSIRIGPSGTPVSTGVGYGVGTTFLVAMKWELDPTGSNNNFYIWLFDNPTAAGLGGPDLLTSTALASFTGLSSAELAFKSMGMYFHNVNNLISVDEFRFGLTYADVTPVIPEPKIWALTLGFLIALLIIQRARKCGMVDNCCGR